jgi:hypothetical protein
VLTASDLAVDASEIQCGRIARYLPAGRIAGADKESNWPTPPGQFNLTLRNYYPKEWPTTHLQSTGQEDSMTMV